MISYNDSFLSDWFCTPQSTENRLGQIDWGRVKELNYFLSMLNYTCYVVEIVWNIKRNTSRIENMFQALVK
jgi:hypothetical protein